jgi:hypothetical protein
MALLVLSSKPSCPPVAKMPPSKECCRTRDSRCVWCRSTLGGVTDVNQNRELQIMRIVRHPNIVELKAFYYSNGERVHTALPILMTSLTNIRAAERRSLPQSRSGIRTRDSLPCLAIFQQDEDDNANPGSQALHLSTLQIAGLHPLSRHLPSRHQAPKPSARSCKRRSQTV